MQVSKLSARLTNTFDKRYEQNDQTIDFLIDGVSLSEILKLYPESRLGVLTSRFVGNELTRKKLKLEIPSGLPEGRVELFVCPACGDIGCGSMTVKLEITPTGFRWSDFAEENDYDPQMTDRESFASVGPFEFEHDNYCAAIDCGSAVLPT